MAKTTVKEPGRVLDTRFEDETKSREAVLRGERNSGTPDSLREIGGAVLCLARAREFDAIKDVLRTAHPKAISSAISQIYSMGRLDVLGEIVRGCPELDPRTGTTRWYSAAGSGEIPVSPARGAKASK